MAANKGKEGKKFEEDIKRSFEDEFLYHLRLKDTSSSFAHDSKSRFTVTNPCDFISFNIYNKKILYLECKSTEQRSLPLNNFKKHQLDEMMEADNKYKHIEAYCLINYRKSEKTYCIRTKYIYNFYYSKDGVNTEERKSIPEDFVKEFGIEITHRKKRTRFHYFINDLFYRLANE
jgi:recombination protein U